MRSQAITALFLLAPTLGLARVLPRQANLQTFTGALGGIAAIPVTDSGDAKRPFAVDGTTDVNIKAALQRSCDVQKNQCSNAANSSGNKGAVTVSACEAQHTQCISSSSNAQAPAAGSATSSSSGNVSSSSSGSAAAASTSAVAADTSSDAASTGEDGCPADTGSDATTSASSSAASSAAASSSSAGNAASAANGAVSFGKCDAPSISFGIFDGRKENSFKPTNLAQFNHGSALNINIITQFECDQLVNSCGANQAAVAKCAAAKTAPNGLTGQAAADAFNKAVSS